MSNTAPTQEKSFFFFYKHRLSNWHKYPFIANGVRFNCSEQAMMYFKALVFGDIHTADKILKAEEPKEQQKLGREVKGFNQEIWDKVKYKIVKYILIQKFQQDEDSRNLLLSVEEDELVEASPYDKVWGIGLSAKDAAKIPYTEWPGENLLGKILTEIRNELKLSLNK